MWPDRKAVLIGEVLIHLAGEGGVVPHFGISGREIRGDVGIVVVGGKCGEGLKSGCCSVKGARNLIVGERLR